MTSVAHLSGTVQRLQVLAVDADVEEKPLNVVVIVANQIGLEPVFEAEVIDIQSGVLQSARVRVVFVPITRFPAGIFDRLVVAKTHDWSESQTPAYVTVDAGRYLCHHSLETLAHFVCQ